MLAQNFKTADDLDLSDDEYEALIKVLGMLERGEIQYHRMVPDGPIKPNGFNMLFWDCGTVHCIGGWADVIMGRPSFFKKVDSSWTDGLWDLIYPPMSLRECWGITDKQAAMALRNYLTSGEPRWDEVLAYDRLGQRALRILKAMWGKL